MKNITAKSLILLAVLVAFPLAHAEDEPVPQGDTGKVPNLDYDEINPEEWGIRNGCILTRNIERFSYLSPNTAKIEMRDGKTVIMTFRNRCYGLANRGVIYKSTNGRLCARFDSVRVIEYETVCLIESIDPFIDIDGEQNDSEDEPKNEPEKTDE